MKHITKLAALAVSLSLVLSPVAQAHDRDQRDDKRPYQSQQYKQHQNKQDQHKRQSDRRHDDRRQASAQNARHYHGSYWKVGQKVPDRYRGQHYVVQTWKKHNLHQPPRGYQWVSVDSNYFLVGVATGVVLQTILNR